MQDSNMTASSQGDQVDVETPSKRDVCMSARLVSMPGSDETELTQVNITLQGEWMPATAPTE